LLIELRSSRPGLLSCDGDRAIDVRDHDERLSKT
jgi:hypothetical protein